MTQQPPFAPEPPQPRRGFIPFPIIGPGCCGCGFVASLLLAAGTIGGGIALHHDAPQASSHTGTAVVQEHAAH